MCIKDMDREKTRHIEKKYDEHYSRNNSRDLVLYESKDYMTVFFVMMHNKNWIRNGSQPLINFECNLTIM